MCQECIKSPTIREDIKTSLAEAIDHYNTTYRSRVDTVLEQMQENISGSLKEGVTDIEEILRRNVEIVNQLMPPGQSMSEEEMMKFVRQARKTRKEETGYDPDAVMKIIEMAKHPSTVEEDREQWPDDMHAALMRGVVHYMSYHYTNWEIYHPLFSNEFLDAQKIFADNYVGQLLDRVEEEGLAIVLDRNRLGMSLSALARSINVEGAVIGYYAGSRAQDCLLGELHDHPHGVFTSPEEETPDEFDARLELIARLAHSIASEKEEESSEKEAEK